MDKNHHKGLSRGESLNSALVEHGSDVEDDETRALLPAEDASLSKTPTRKKVQWLDSCGDNKLAEILEFQPSDLSDSEEEEEDLCLCRIM